MVEMMHAHEQLKCQLATRPFQRQPSPSSSWSILGESGSSGFHAGREGGSHAACLHMRHYPCTYHFMDHLAGFTGKEPMWCGCPDNCLH